MSTSFLDFLQKIESVSTPQKKIYNEGIKVKVLEEKVIKQETIPLKDISSCAKRAAAICEGVAEMTPPQTINVVQKSKKVSAVANHAKNLL